MPTGPDGAPAERGETFEAGVLPGEAPRFAVRWHAGEVPVAAEFPLERLDELIGVLTRLANRCHRDGLPTRPAPGPPGAPAEHPRERD